MPIFDFKCRACGHEFEALVLPRATPLCAACQSPDLERLLSSFAVSSAERTQAAATVKRKKAAATAHKDSIATEREMEAHRKEDH